MWDGLKKMDRVLMAVARPFVWLCVILFAVGFIGGLIQHAILVPSPASLALIAVVLLAVLVWLVRRPRTK